MNFDSDIKIAGEKPSVDVKRNRLLAGEMGESNGERNNA